MKTSNVKFLFFSLIIAFGFYAPLITFGAGFKGEIEFVPGEVVRGYLGSKSIAEGAAQCLDQALEFHQSFYKQWGISPFYGDNSAFAKLNDAEKNDFLINKKIPPEILAQLQSTSCVGLVIQCLEAGFTKANLSETWKKLRTFLRANDQDGLALQEALRSFGWQILYWNPNTSRNDDFDAYEVKNDPNNDKKRWGYHSYRWKTVTTHGAYLYNHVDDHRLMVDFGIRPPKAFKKVPFFIGTAHGGYHVFSGKEGMVIEAHSMRAIEDPTTVESAPFNPLTKSGAPSGGYWSGLIAIPPGTLQLLDRY